jgi:uncharacterized repeat protein (TIGR01451 family)
MNIKKALTTALATGIFLTAAGISFADGSSNCQIIYGGGQVCNNNIQYTINKMVEVPGTTNFTDNLNVNDSKYSADTIVPFKIIITNTGDTKIGHIKVTDSIPQYLTFASGDGNFDANSRKITFDVNNLDAGAAQQFMVNLKVVDNNQLPSDQSTVCVVNQVNAFEDSGVTAADSSQVCITREIANVTPTPVVFTTVPPKKIPNTGPEMLPLLGLIPAGISGLFLRKKSKIS